ncbi:MAG: hypothetical protein COC15_02305 [Legionellales bacterium]|nr:MAG: hypothetical protein COC15_02305 [Legionellales bacterium]
MKFRLKLYILLLTMPFVLSGCSNDIMSTSSIHWQLKPNAPEEKVVQGVNISYNIPKYIYQNKSIEDILYFERIDYGTPNKQEKVLIKTCANRWQIERRTDNGVAGSGRVYDIEVSKEPTDVGTKISFVVKKERTYQEGVILPFAVPAFDIKKYLARASITYSFELNSKYDVKSIKANFDRLLGKSNVNKYYLKTNLAAYSNRVKFYPYRGGTKVVINSTIYNMKYQNDIINVHKIINSLKRKIAEIVDA